MKPGRSLAVVVLFLCALSALLGGRRQAQNDIYTATIPNATATLDPAAQPYPGSPSETPPVAALLGEAPGTLAPETTTLALETPGPTASDPSEPPTGETTTPSPLESERATRTDPADATPPVEASSTAGATEVPPPPPTEASAPTTIALPTETSSLPEQVAPTETSSPSASPTATSAPTNTPLPTATATPSETPTSTPTPAPTSTPTHTPVPILVDDSVPGIQYGNWRSVGSPLAFGSGYHAASAAGSSVSHTTSTATSNIAIMTYIGPDQGKAEVLIDGQSKGIVDLYSPQPFSVNLPYGNLPLQSHTVTFRATGQNHSASVGSEVRFDGLLADQTTIDDGVATLSYDGWEGATSSQAYGGSFRRARAAGTTITFSVSGPSFTWLSARGPDAGLAEVRIDNAEPQTIDLYNDSAQPQHPIQFSNLADEPHQVEIRVLGSQNQAATNSYVVVDGFRTP